MENPLILGHWYEIMWATKGELKKKKRIILGWEVETWDGLVVEIYWFDRADKMSYNKTCCIGKRIIQNLLI